MEKFLCDQNYKKIPFEQILQNFLFTYRNSPTVTTGLTPAEMVFKTKPRTRFELLKPNLNHEIGGECSSANTNRKLYSVNEKVFCKNLADKKWVCGKIVRVLSSVTYLVQIMDKIQFMHEDSLRSAPEGYVDISLRKEGESKTKNNQESVGLQKVNVPIVDESQMDSDTTSPVIENDDTINDAEENMQVPIDPPLVNEQKINCDEYLVPRQSGRTIKQPHRLDL